MNEHPYLYNVDLQQLKDKGTLYFLRGAEYEGRHILLTAFDPRDGSGLVFRAFYGDRWSGEPLKGPVDVEQSPENPALYNFAFNADSDEAVVTLLESYVQGLVLPRIWKLAVRVLSFFKLVKGPQDVSTLGLMDEAVRYFEARFAEQGETI